MTFKSPNDVPEFIRDALDGGDALDANSPAIESLLADVAAASGTTAPSASAKSRLLGGVNAGALRYAPFFAKLGDLFDLSRESVIAVCERSLSGENWEDGPHPAVKLLHLQGGPRVAGADVGLVTMPSEFPWANHRHLGEERVLLIEGSYLDIAGKVYRPGDFHEMPANSQHSFHVQPGSRLVIAIVLFGGFEIVQP